MYAIRSYYNALMMSAMDGINALFSNASTPLQTARVMGLGLVNRAGMVRNNFV